MKRFLFGFLAIFFLILNTIPYLHIMADDMPTDSQYEMLGAYALSTLITSGEATELDFSDYTENDTSFLIDLGEAIFTGDWSGLAEDGLEWLGETADSVYDSYKEYVSQWKSDHLGIMYSNWFPDEQIYVGPDDSYSLAKPLRELLTPRGDSTVPTPNPDPNYSDFINCINGSYRWGNLVSYYDLSTVYNGNSENLVKTLAGSTLYSHPNQYQNFILTYDLGSYRTGVVKGDSVETIYIYQDNSGFHITDFEKGLDTQTFFYTWNSPPYCAFGTLNLDSHIGSATNGMSANVYTYKTSSYQATYNNLTDLFTFLVQSVRYVNIYVDNVPWSLVDSNEPTYPIVIPGQLTIYNNQPLEYSFPADTHIDLPDLTNIIRNAINSSGVVMWSDIADCFVDVNGQTAVAVTKIVRNDYDNLYMEQYPYPAMLIGMTDQTKFNEHLLDNSHAYLSPMGTVVQETVNVLPSELVGVLAIGAILTIFAVIINRLLE